MFSLILLCCDWLHRNASMNMEEISFLCILSDIQEELSYFFKLKLDCEIEWWSLCTHSMKAVIMPKETEKQIFLNMSEPLSAFLGLPPQLSERRQQQKQQPTHGMTNMKMIPIAMQIIYPVTVSFATYRKKTWMKMFIYCGFRLNKIIKPTNCWPTPTESIVLLTKGHQHCILFLLDSVCVYCPMGGRGSNI